MRALAEIEKPVVNLALRLWKEQRIHTSGLFYPLSRDDASAFRPLYLDMVLDAVFLFYRDGSMRGLLGRLRGRLEELGSRRVELPRGGWYWVQRPELAPGEAVES